MERRLLLDTHAFLWWLNGERRFPVAVRRQIIAAKDVYVSAASVWEIATKARLGKLPEAREVAENIVGCILEQSFASLDITSAHAACAGNLPGPHRDPFDRMLIAQCQLESLALVSADEVFDAYGVKRLW